MLQVLVVALLLSPQAQPPEKCSLSGTVVDSVTGEPLSKVDITLDPLDRQANHIAITISDAKGRFGFLDLDPASYRLKGKRNGYLEMAYGARRPSSDGTVVRLEAGQSLTGFKFELTPAAVVAGTVRDSDGEPLEDAHVILGRFTYLYGKPRVKGYDSTNTDDRGEYRFRGLAAGKYYIGVEGKSHGWDQVDHSSNDYDMRSPTRNAAGDFEIRGVPPGSYELTASTVSLNGKAPVTVSGTDVEGVRMTLAPGAEIKLRISAESDEKPDLSRFEYFLTANGSSGYGSMPFESDRFTVRNVPPDHYVLKLPGWLPRRFYVKSARAGETDVLADGLTVEGPGAIDIDVVLASDGAFVEGVVGDADKHPVPGATVLLAPDSRSRADLFKSTTTDQNGHYEFVAVAPGDYRVFAFDDVEPEIWNDPDFLKHYEKQGEKTILEANTRKGVSVHLATRPDSE